MKLRSIVGALVVAATALALGTVAPAGASDTAAQLGRPTTHVRLTLYVYGCGQHCKVDLIQAIEGRDRVWESGSKRVRHHYVTFHVRPSRTRGMSILVQPRWLNADYQPNVAYRFDNTRRGDAITDRTARRADRGFGCWAGTHAASYSMEIDIVGFRYHGTGGMRHSAREYVRTAMATIPPGARTFRGSIGGQEPYYCSAG